MIIDFHTHCFPERIAASTVDKLTKLSHVTPFVNGTAADLTASMDTVEIDLSIVLPVATNPKQVPHVNDAAAAQNEAEGRHLFSFGCIHPDYPEWREELSRIASLGMKGIKIHPVYQNTDIDHPNYLRILERAGELDLIVVTHGGSDIGFPCVEHCSPAMIRRAVQQVGPVKFVVAHMGGWRSWDDVEEMLADTGVYLDTAFSSGFLSPLDDGYYTPEDLPLLDEARFLHMVRTFGAHRILFGTDSPWTDQKESLEWLRSLPLSQEDLSAILGGNAQKLLNL